MATAMGVDRSRFLIAAAALALAALLCVVRPAAGATVVEEDRPAGDVPQRAEGPAVDERIVVEPRPGSWPGRDAWRDWSYPGAPRVRVTVDRGDGAFYETGDRIAVYFQVDRPCYLTVLDYTTDGDVEVLFPSGWSGSGYVHPGETYRVPDSPRYALRVTGPPGVETIVACAHEVPWPGGARGAWVLPGWSWGSGWRTGPEYPRRGGRRGAVVVEPSRPRGGRIAIDLDWWPVPPDWYDIPERWSCDEVSFYVSGGTYHDFPYRDRMWEDDRHRNESWPGASFISERFEMWRCTDEFSRAARYGDDEVRVAIRCVESEQGRPTEIVGRAFLDDDPDAETLFRLDALGRRGDEPRVGAVYRRRLGPFAVEAEIVDVETSGDSDEPRIEWIRFQVMAYPD